MTETTHTHVSRPTPDECSSYHWEYVRKVPEGDLIAILAEQAEATAALFEGLADEQGMHRYAPEKWSVKELLGHLVDTERIMAFRCLSIARGERADLPGFDEDAYVAAAGFDRRELADMVAEFRTVRAATLALLRGLDDEALRRRGSANGFTVSARAAAYIIAGHELHHRGILIDRYGLGRA